MRLDINSSSDKVNMKLLVLDIKRDIIAIGLHLDVEIIEEDGWNDKIASINIRRSTLKISIHNKQINIEELILVKRKYCNNRAIYNKEAIGLVDIKDVGKIHHIIRGWILQKLKI